MYLTLWDTSFTVLGFVSFSEPDYKDSKEKSKMEILYILVPSVTIPLAIALLFFFICICRNNQKSSSPPVQRQPKHVRGQNVEMSMLNAYKPKVIPPFCLTTGCLQREGVRSTQRWSITVTPDFQLVVSAGAFTSEFCKGFPRQRRNEHAGLVEVTPESPCICINRSWRDFVVKQATRYWSISEMPHLSYKVVWIKTWFSVFSGEFFQESAVVTRRLSLRWNPLWKDTFCVFSGLPVLSVKNSNYLNRALNICLQFWPAQPLHCGSSCCCCCASL